MDVSLVGQPYTDQSSLGMFLTKVLDDPAFSELRICVAWAKRSGLSKIRPLMERFLERGTIEIILGISEGGATRQGLDLAVELSTKAFVLFDPTGRTFHPKLYIAKGSDKAAALIGSNNLTAGGVFFNYEIAVECLLNRHDLHDEKFRSEIDQLLDRYIADRGICKPLDYALISKLVDDPRYRIGDETRQNSDAKRSTKPGGKDGLFTSSEHAKRTAKGLGIDIVVYPPLIDERDFDEQVGGVLTGLVARRWSKLLKNTDALRPRQPGSNITGNLRLSQSRHPIDHKTYFRNVFFGDLEWSVDDSPRPSEYVIVPMEVSIGDVTAGVVDVRIDHAPHRVSGQGNVPTVLKWGPTLAPLLRAGNYVDFYVVMEKLKNEKFRLRVQREAPEEFLY